MKIDLSGRRGIVTGASSGLGLAIANVLADAGAHVVGISHEIPADIGEKSSPQVEHIELDITDYPALERLVQNQGEKGLDFLINNAGITVKCRAEEFSDADFERIHKINVSCVFKLCQLSYSYLKQSPHMGRIVNVSSMAAHLGFSEVVPYCSSKSAVLGLTRGLAVEWANDNITVNSVAPGWFPSEMTKSVMDAERKEKILNRMPVHKFGEPKDIGTMMLFLLSDAAMYITGQDFAVDGGALAFGY